MGDKWITTESGSHILVDKNGTIKSGAGGKFNGKKIHEMGTGKGQLRKTDKGTQRFVSERTYQEREKAKQQTASKSTSTQETNQKKINAMSKFARRGILNEWNGKNGDVKRFYPSRELEDRVYYAATEQYDIYPRFYLDPNDAENPLKIDKSYNGSTPNEPLTDDEKKILVKIINEEIQKMNKEYKGEF